jgi:type IV pilus assembly protein PilX
MSVHRPPPLTPSPIDRQQRGTALVMGMVLLVLMSLLGLTAMGTAVLETRMATHARDRIRAFEAAEAGLKACEARLPALRYIADPIPVQEGTDLDLNLPLLDAQPSCTVARVQTVLGGSRDMLAAAHETDSYQVYRLTVTGRGMSGNTVVRLEAHVRQPI